MERSREYAAWAQAKHRCTNPNNPKWSRYGGRGIRMYADWMNSFEAFFAHIGPRPSPKHSLDRHPNPDGNYEPGNVRWAVSKQQNANKSNTRYIEWNGETLTIEGWATRLGLNPNTIKSRLARGKSAEEILRPRAPAIGRRK